jgi:tetratricopeptide (TPR) repeat protein
MVPFEKFRRSMAYLDSGEEAALAFAQVSTMVAYLVELRGMEVLPGILDRIREGEDSMDVVAQAAGNPDFDSFRTSWRIWLKQLPLVQQQLASLPTVLDGEGEDYADDPLLAGRADLARFARLGDLLREKNRPRAALVEYEKAQDPDAPDSPALLARRATCHRSLDELDQALKLVDRGVSLYPEHTLLQVTRAQILDEKGESRRAMTSWNAAHDLNPFDPKVQRALAKGYAEQGDEDRAAHHRRLGSLLASGGVVTSQVGD